MRAGRARLTASQVTVNVYNATNRAGLAASTAKDVKARGFVDRPVANDPLKKKIDGAGELRFGPNGKAGAALVATMLLDGATPTSGHERGRDRRPRHRQRVQGARRRRDTDNQRSREPLLTGQVVARAATAAMASSYPWGRARR